MIVSPTNVQSLPLSVFLSLKAAVLLGPSSDIFHVDLKKNQQLHIRLNMYIFIIIINYYNHTILLNINLLLSTEFGQVVEGVAKLGPFMDFNNRPISISISVDSQKQT